MKLAAIIVVYKPDIPQLESNILSVIDDVDKLLIYRNSPFECNETIIQSYKDKIEFLGDSKNVGIASALNEGVKWVSNNSYTHLLTLDQDSYFEKLHLNKFKNLIENCVLDNIGIYCPNIDNRGTLLLNTEEEFVYLPDSITSGSVFPLSVFKDCGVFDDKLFIDAVDYEFCYRIFYNKQLKTLIFPSIVLRHEVGHLTKIRFGLYTDNYSAFRTYFIIRNHIIIWKKYPHLFQKSYKITLIRIHIIHRFIKIILGEEDKIAKLNSIIKGIYHGLLGKLENKKIC
ncbi:hypothetical protein B4N84_14395 [Flavobacterium sp. IR1]|nr:hypothetical protein B4N84_14395 [Flavobacterium sp. IR1]